jgi:hypothetical protein
MRQKFIAVLVLLVAIVAVGLAGLAQDAPTEAPARFDTPTLVQNPGSQSHSNGIAQPAGDTTPTTKESTKQLTIPARVWDPCLTAGLAPIVIRTP